MQTFRNNRKNNVLGLGRAPGVGLAYLFWCRDWTLEAANDRLQKVRSCGPKIHAIRQATCDLIFGSLQQSITIAVTANPASHVQVPCCSLLQKDILPRLLDWTLVGDLLWN